MQPRDDSRIVDMLTFARRIRERVQGTSRDEFDGDPDLQMALTYLLQVVGEAASHVSPETQSANPDIPWRYIIAMRHHLVHGYLAVDLELVWLTATRDVPALLGALHRMLEQGNTE